MQERARHHRRRDQRLGDSFMVVATQNPIEQQGAYPLPEAQLDRFLFKHRRALSRRRGEELEIVRRHGAPLGTPRPEAWASCRSPTRDELAAARAVVDGGAAGRRASSTMSSALVRATRDRQRTCRRRLAARRGDAGRRGAGARGARRPRLCHPRRRQGAGAAGAAPPRHPRRRPPRSRAARRTMSSPTSSTRWKRPSDPPVAAAPRPRRRGARA